MNHPSCSSHLLTVIDMNKYLIAVFCVLAVVYVRVETTSDVAVHDLMLKEAAKHEMT